MARVNPDPGPGIVTIVACGALAREILAIKEANKLDHIRLTCIPATIHMEPDKIPEAVRASIRQEKETGAKIYVAFADCGTGGLLDKVLEEENVERIEGPHCYSFYTGNDAFAAMGDDDLRCFYLTDFLVRQFENIFFKPLGLDRHPELLDIYFEHYEKLVYLAQSNDSALDEAAEAAAQRLNLTYERRQTGFGDLTSFVKKAAQQ